MQKPRSDCIIIIIIIIQTKARLCLYVVSNQLGYTQQQSILCYLKVRNFSACTLCEGANKILKLFIALVCHATS